VDVMMMGLTSISHLKFSHHFLKPFRKNNDYDKYTINFRPTGEFICVW
jgi:hypothetical protein